MPRHSSLIPLSHDHHEALLIALRLKKRGPASQHDRLWSDDPEKQLHALRFYFERELIPHFQLEEEILFPAARRIPELHSIVSKLIAEHATLREMIRVIFQRTADDQELTTLLSEFGALLESHVRSEERELFPKLEEAEKEGRFVIPQLQ